MNTQIVEAILGLMDEHRNPKDAAQMKAYMKGHFEYFGIKSTERRSLFNAVFRKKEITSPEMLIDLVDKLWAVPEREAQYIAMDMLDKFKPWMDVGMLPHVERWISQKSWWDSVDHLAAHQVGIILSSLDQGQRRTIAERYLASGFLWLQRTAIIFQLNYKEEIDTSLLEDAIFSTIGEKDFFIRKAHGWALRQHSKSDKAYVADFINKYKDQLSPLAIREGSKYI